MPALLKSDGVRKHKTMAEINMIPLIDITLILLIIFMVLTPMLMQSQIPIRLPKSTATAQSSAQDIRIQISASGRIFLNEKAVPLSRLEKALALRLHKASEQTVLVQADKSVPIEKIVSVLDVARNLGVGKLGIGVASK